MDLIIARPEGLYCPAGDFYIDPWQPVERAVITHGHGDHARAGNRYYLTAEPGKNILLTRLGDIALDTLPYGTSVTHNGVQISFHPAGHVLGSAQVRIEYRGEVWVASGDYKLESDGTCTPFVPVPCHTFITESTFGLPIYRWPAQATLFNDINQWWRSNAAEDRTSVLFCYAFGKAQRVQAGLDASIGPIMTHGAVESLNRVYRAAGVTLPPTSKVSDNQDKTLYRHALILAPPSAQSSPWMRRFGEYADAFASGWMQLRGARRRRGVNRGFVMSDHADWNGLHTAIQATGATRVFVTHGSAAPMVRYLREQGVDAHAFETHYGEALSSVPS